METKGARNGAFGGD